MPAISFFTGRMPFLPTYQQRQSTEGNQLYWHFAFSALMLLVGRQEGIRPVKY